MTHKRPVPQHRAARAVLFSLSLACALGILDFWAYHRTTFWMEQQLAALQTTCQTHGTTLSIGHITRHGWPFGAALSLSHVQLVSQNATIQIGGATSALEFGGHWGLWGWAFMHDTTPVLQSDGETILRILYHDKDLTLKIHALRLTPSLTHSDSHQTVGIQADTVRFSSDTTALSGALKTLDGQLYWKSHAKPEESAFATALNAQKLSLSQPTFALRYPLTHLHLIAALPGCNASLTTPHVSHCTLRLHDLSADVPTSEAPSMRLSFAGIITLPDGDGTLTAQLSHWRENARQLLASPMAQQQLSPDILNTIQHTLLPPSPAPALSPDHPLSMSLSLSHALPTGLTREKIHMFQELLSHTP